MTTTTTQTYRRARHSVSVPHAHLVFVTKYRRAVFTDAMLTFCEQTMRGVCAELDVELVEFNGGDLGPGAAAQRPRTAYAVRREFTGVCVARMRRHLWSPSYFAVSCGGAPLSIIKQHIHGQARPL